MAERECRAAVWCRGAITQMYVGESAGGEAMVAWKAAVRALSRAFLMSDFTLTFLLLPPSLICMCGWSGWPRLHLKLIVAFPSLHFNDIVDSFSDFQRWINSIREANMKPASEFPSIT